jgi:uncharacterized membrane protein HdeD (DUF308 family)
VRLELRSRRWCCRSASTRLIEAIFAVIAGISGRREQERWWMILEDVAGIVIGVLMFLYPDITALILL